MQKSKPEVTSTLVNDIRIVTEDQQSDLRWLMHTSAHSASATKSACHAVWSAGRELYVVPSDCLRHAVLLITCR